ncbi:MAG: cytochrome o ubiquinol oxidase subunit I, partial [Minisyncoccia bacterium]
PHYEDIEMPNNTPMGLYIALASGVFGFAIVWHIIWLVVLTFVTILALLIARSFDYDTDYVVSVEEIRKIEGARNK